MKKHQKQERRLAKKLKGRARKNSGAGPYAKGDVESDIWLAECKRTDKSQIVLRKSVLEKIEQEAAQAGKDPLLELEIQDRRFYVLMDYQFESFVSIIRKCYR